MFFNRQVGSPRFKVAAPPAQTVTVGTPIKLPFATVVTDPNNYWDAVNFRWVPKVAGWYACCTNITFTSAASTVFGTVVPQLRVNGTTMAGAGIQPNLSAQALNSVGICEAILQFNGTTDFLEAWMNFVATTGTWVTPSNGNGANTCFLQAFYLGP